MVLGYILYQNENNQSPRFKYLRESFSYMKELLGNTPNMYLRYLECKFEGREVELVMSVPNIRYYASWVEKSLNDICLTAYNLYVEKYIKRQPDMFINYFYRPILHDLHMKYNELRNSNNVESETNKTRAKITMQTVQEVVRKYHPKRLHFILNGLKYINTMNIIDPTVQSTEVVQEPNEVSEVTEVTQ